MDSSLDTVDNPELMKNVTVQLIKRFAHKTLNPDGVF